MNGFIRSAAALAAVTLLVTMGVAGADHAIPPKGSGGPHEDIPLNVPVLTSAKAICQIGGVMVWEAGLSAQPSHDHYTLDDFDIDCRGVEQNLTGGFVADIAGGTDGFGVTSGVHGETCSKGWSHSSKYPGDPSTQKPGKIADANKGSFTLRHSGTGKAGSGWMKFTRVGMEMKIWGWIVWADGKKPDKFLGEMKLRPTKMSNGKAADAHNVILACDPTSNPQKKIKEAWAEGELVIGNGTNPGQ